MYAFYINCMHEYQHLLQCLDSKDPGTLPIHTSPSSFQQIRVFYPVFPLIGEQHEALGRNDLESSAHSRCQQCTSPHNIHWWHIFNRGQKHNHLFRYLRTLRLPFVRYINNTDIFKTWDKACVIFAYNLGCTLGNNGHSYQACVSTGTQDFTPWKDTQVVGISFHLLQTMIIRSHI